MPKNHRAPIISQENLRPLFSRTEFCETYRKFVKKRGLVKKIRLILMPESNCNLNCSYCGTKESRGTFRPTDKELEKIIDAAAEVREKYHIKLCFSGGGEPTLNPERFIKLTKYAKEKGFEIHAVTNSYNARKSVEHAKRLFEHCNEISPTIDSERINQRDKEGIIEGIANTILACTKTGKIVILRVISDKKELTNLFKHVDAGNFTKGDTGPYELQKRLQDAGLAFELYHYNDHKDIELIRMKYRDICAAHIEKGDEEGIIFIVFGPRQSMDEIYGDTCSNIDGVSGWIVPEDIVYTGNLYGCCSFVFNETEPLLTKPQISKILKTGENPIEKSIDQLYSKKFLLRCLGTCNDCVEMGRKKQKEIEEATRIKGESTEFYNIAINEPEFILDGGICCMFRLHVMCETTIHIEGGESNTYEIKGSPEYTKDLKIIATNAKNMTFIPEALRNQVKEE